MTHSGSKLLDICSWPTLGACYAENRGQKVGHLAKMHDFCLKFEQHYIDLYITFTILVLDMTYLGNKYNGICTWTTVGTGAAKNRGQELSH